MGQTLSEPVTSKETSTCENERYKVASSCMQGWRMNMEDAHAHILTLDNSKDTAFFAVYDGHGGAKVAQYAGEHLHQKLASNQHFKDGNVEDAMKQGFLELDEDMLNDEDMKEELAGTTACVVVVKDGKIYCGNVGDSRAVVSVKGEVHQLSYDHKPTNEIETKRILAAGGWVEFNRVNGNLALSRALGDFVFKRNDHKGAEEQIVTAFPDVEVYSVTGDVEFMVLACDGIWDVLTNQEVLDFVSGAAGDSRQQSTQVNTATISDEVMIIDHNLPPLPITTPGIEQAPTHDDDDGVAMPPLAPVLPGERSGSGRVFQCRVCPYTCKWKHDLVKHHHSVHLRLKPYKCPHCSYCGSRSHHLNSHVQRRHLTTIKHLEHTSS